MKNQKLFFSLFIILIIGVPGLTIYAVNQVQSIRQYAAERPRPTPKPTHKLTPTLLPTAKPTRRITPTLQPTIKPTRPLTPTRQVTPTPRV